VDPSVREVAEDQEEIGWHHILKGRFSRKWKQTQDRYLGTRADEKVNGGTWMTKVITKWFEQWLKLWKMRNEDRHGRDEATARHARDRQTIREATLFYEAYQDKDVGELQWLFTTPLQDRLQGNLENLRIWTQTWQPVVEKSYTTSLTTS
jgi:hypothetical protein